jgi:hypothetical protein
MSDAPFDIGETVADRDQDNPKPAIVVNLPPQTADEWIAYTNTTVAEDNPDYPPDAPIIVVVYRHDLAAFDPDWSDHDGPFSLAELNEAGVSHYSFPAPRLRSLSSGKDGGTTGVADTDSNNDVDSDSDSDTNERENDDPEGTSTNEKKGETDPMDEETIEPTDDSNPDPSAAVRALEQRLNEGGMTTNLEADGQTIRATKLGETYRLRPSEVLDGDGALRSRLEEIVAAADQQSTD